MSFEPNPQQVFLIFSMLFGRTASEKEPSFSAAPIEKAPRDALERAGFIRCELRGRSTYIVLEERAWAWAAEHLSAQLPGRPKRKPRGKPTAKSKEKRARKPNASDVLEAVLSRLQNFLREHDHALADFVRAAGASSETAAGARSAELTSDVEPAGRGELTMSSELESRVRNACLELAHGAVKQRVRLKDLRAKVLGGRSDLDRALLKMQNEGKLVLFRIENPAELTPDDERAALYVADNPRHLVYLEA